MQSKKDFFKHYPKVDEFHFTSDGQAFFTKSEADAHATSLADKKVSTEKRETFAKELEADAKAEAKAKADADAKAKADALAEAAKTGQ